MYLLVTAIRDLRIKLKEKYNLDVDIIRLRDNFKDLKPDSSEFEVDHIIPNLKVILL